MQKTNKKKEELDTPVIKEVSETEESAEELTVRAKTPM